MNGIRCYFKAVLCLLLFCLPCLHVSAGGGDRLSSSFRKECKKSVKQLKKEGWTVNGVSQSLDNAMEAHYAVYEKAGKDAFVIEGHAQGKSLSVAVSKAMNDAARQYASMQESEIEGRTLIEMTNETSDEASTNTKMNASYVSSTRQKVKAFTPTVTLYRQQNGNYEVKALYVVGK